MRVSQGQPITLLWAASITAGLGLVIAAAMSATAMTGDRSGRAADLDIVASAQAMIEAGRRTFRHDTFGSEEFWGGKLRLHEAIGGAAAGGTGPGLAPTDALSIGLKVDLDALPSDVQRDMRAGAVPLRDPATTLKLLQLDAVVGIQGFFDGGRLRSVGIRCALCHSTVDDTLAKGIGRRLDGWANRDLEVGAIIALAPDLSPFARLLSVDEAAVREVFRSWGPGKFDAELVLDGKAVRPDGGPAATLIPPAFGLAGINLHTWTGWGSVPHWNAFVANLEMQGKGTFYDPRLNDAARFPIAAREGFGNVRSAEDRITPALPALHLYQLAIPAPPAPPGSFDARAAERGRVVFEGKARCATCHVPPLYTEPGWNLHTPEEIGIDGFQASRSPDGRYRTAPLKGLWTHTKGGFYHDGRFATLDDVIGHYDGVLDLGLTQDQRHDLVEHLKSL